MMSSVKLVLLLSLCGHLAHGYSGGFWNRNSKPKDVCDKSGKDPPFVTSTQKWTHAGLRSTVTLHCQICLKQGDDSKYKVIWKKDGKIVKSSIRIRQLTHSGTEYLLRIHNLMDKDFGVYFCYIRGLPDKGHHIEVSGVPYPPEFDYPTHWSPTSIKLMWSVNSSTPIVNHELEFREVIDDDGEWVKLNVPGDLGGSRLQQRSHVLNNYGLDHTSNKDIVHQQSYMLRGLSENREYEARVRSRNSYGLSAQSEVLAFDTYEERPEDANQIQKLKQQNELENKVEDPPEVVKKRDKKRRREQKQQQRQQQQAKDEQDPVFINDKGLVDASSEPLYTKDEQENEDHGRRNVFLHSNGSRGLVVQHNQKDLVFILAMATTLLSLILQH